jgi:hypothetical protein
MSRTHPHFPILTCRRNSAILGVYGDLIDIAGQPVRYIWTTEFILNLGPEGEPHCRRANPKQKGEAMSSLKRILIVLGLSLAAATALWAQRGGGMGMMGNMPAMPGLQNPTVGSGSEYLMTSKGKEMDMSTVALGKEEVDGATGYWMETRMTSAEMGGEMVMKTLTVISPTESGIKRMIMQQPGKPPMEMSGMMMSMMQRNQAPPTTPSGGGGGKGMGELVGTESVTVPAGTFTCQHYRSNQKNGPADIWISTQITPYGLVKMTSADSTMVLKKVLTNETSHIKGEPQKMQTPQMPHF